jgi:hypothetical protein
MKLYSLSTDGAVDPKALGPRLIENWSGILNRLDDWRAAHPEVRMVDVHYTDLIADPIGNARRLYEAFGLTLSDTTEQAMAAHLETDHHGKGTARRYGLSDFGLTEDDIERAFGPYIERHEVAREVRT